MKMDKADILIWIFVAWAGATACFGLGVISYIMFVEQLYWWLAFVYLLVALFVTDQLYPYDEDMKRKRPPL